MLRLPRRVVSSSILALLAGCGDGEPETTAALPPAAAETAPAVDASEALFVDVAAEVGLDFVHWNGRVGEYYYGEMMGSGGAFVDYDGDGDLDVFLVQGNLLGDDPAAAVDPAPGELPLSDRLYRNELVPSGTLRFTDVTAESGIAAIGRARPTYGMGVATGDLDDDGDVDLYVTALGENRLYENRGDGTFADATARSGTGERRWSVPAVVADLDRDGRLDLFVGNYVDWSVAADKRCTDELGGRNYCGPLAYAPLVDTLYRNQGGLAFADATRAAGLAEARGATLGATALDADGDGWLDLYVGNDGAANRLWRNRGDGSFEDVAVVAGVAVNGAGHPEASMGVAAADYDADADEDLLLGHLSRETNTLYRADARVWRDVSAASGLGPPSFDRTAFGIAWLDVENDGDLDVVAANGAVKVIKELALAGDPYPLHQTNQLFLARGDGTYAEAGAEAGPAFALSEVSRGVATGDVDDDGDADVLVTQNGGPVRLLLDRVGQDRPWLGLRLTTADGRRDAIGAWAGLERAGASTLWRRVMTSGSYASASDPRLLFGLGDAATVTGLVVRWPDGRWERFAASRLAVGAYRELRQGSGATAEAP